MTDPTQLDAHEIHEQTRSLASHLLQAGVHFLPIANPEQTDAWSKRFEQDPADGLATDEKTSDEKTQEQGPDAPSPDSAATEMLQPEGTKVPNQATPAKPPLSSSVTHSGPRIGVPSEAQAEPVSIEGDYDSPNLPLAERQASLKSLAAEVAACQRCEVLSSCRTNTVFGEGSPQARFVFFGEGPRIEEDNSGRPFVGDAGQLLSKMIAACTLDLKDVFLFNTVKCRPPGNRNPDPSELANCRSYYQTQLRLIQPEYIICLGAIAAQELLQTKLPVGILRGEFHDYHTSKVLVTYHPTYLLRNQSAKKAAWTDLQILMKDAGLGS